MITNKPSELEMFGVRSPWIEKAILKATERLLCFKRVYAQRIDPRALAAKKTVPALEKCEGSCHHNAVKPSTTALAGGTNAPLTFTKNRNSKSTLRRDAVIWKQHFRHMRPYKPTKEYDNKNAKQQNGNM